MNQKMESFFKKFQKEDVSASELEKAEKLANLLGEGTEDLKLMINMVRDVTKGRYSVNKVDLAMLIGAVIYVVSPVDAIPDIIPVLGWTDDIGVLAFVVKKCSDTLKDYSLFAAQKVEVEEVESDIG